MLKQKGFVIWFTGLSGSGKSTIASHLEKILHQQGYLTYWLDGDNIRHYLNQDLGFSDSDRKENIRRIAEVAALFKEAGVVTLVSCISPHQAMRDFARQRIRQDQFIEIYTQSSLETCKQRDTKGLYRDVQQGKIKEFTGIDLNYEIPKSPEIVLDTEQNKIATNLNFVLNYLAQKDFIQLKQVGVPL